MKERKNFVKDTRIVLEIFEKLSDKEICLIQENQEFKLRMQLIKIHKWLKKEEWLLVALEFKERFLK